MCFAVRIDNEVAMKIYTSNGDLGFKTFNFPDGQPHFELLGIDDAKEVTIETRLINCQDIIVVLLALDVLSRFYLKVNLDIRYMLGARMDRPIDTMTPKTLEILSSIILSTPKWHRIRILDPHSNATVRTLWGEAVYPVSIVNRVVRHLGLPNKLVVIAPDKGATSRTMKLAPAGYEIVQCLKHRDSATGKLSNFEVTTPEKVANKDCIIIDDICDGGRTFTGLSAKLREAGVEKVHLYVTHGIFSAGHRLEGIDSVWTTDSYHSWDKVPFGPNCIPVRMRDMK